MNICYYSLIFFYYIIEMDSVNDIPTDAKGVSGFFKYVFDFDETNKALIFNMLQYAVIAIIPTVLVLKAIGFIIPEEDETKGSVEIGAEVIAQLVLLILSIWFINKMVRYIPTYSGVAYHAFNESNFLIPFLVIMLTMQTRLGEKIRILSDRVMELWEGRKPETGKPGEKNANGVKVSQPISGANQGGVRQPPLVNNSTLGLSGVTGHGQPMTQSAHAAALTPPHQDPNFNQFYENDPMPLMNANEPVAANEMGSAFGSAW
jgi:hypothetical protein